MNETIIEEISNVCSHHVLFVVESGSRVWGNNSPTSDFDIRFVYIKSQTDYLKVFTPKDETLTRRITVDGMDLDIVGWDIYKFLQLLAKSNPTVLEWIHSPIVYQDNGHLQDLNSLSLNFSRYALFMHYKSLALGNYRRYVKDLPTASSKIYLYILRGMLSAIYLLEFSSFPPLDLKSVVDSLRELPYWGVGTLSTTVSKLVTHLQEGKEYRVGSDLTYWIADTFPLLDEAENKLLEKSKQEIDKEGIEAFLATLLITSD